MRKYCPIPTLSLQDKGRFKSKFRKLDKHKCWIWLPNKNRPPEHYGIFYIKDDGYSAHRISYEVHKGKIPYGLCVLHKCDNRVCVNPNHLFLGTYLDNNRDKARKGRCNPSRGEEIHCSKLKEHQVIKIRKLRASGLKLKDLAKKFGVTETQISYIANRKQWTHI